jgi:hypothetical protein
MNADGNCKQSPSLLFPPKLRTERKKMHHVWLKEVASWFLAFVKMKLKKTPFWKKLNPFLSPGESKKL